MNSGWHVDAAYTLQVNVQKQIFTVKSVLNTESSLHKLNSIILNMLHSKKSSFKLGVTL